MIARPARPTFHPVTSDGRYFVVAKRLWRLSNPGLVPEERQALVDQLMTARRQVGIAVKAGQAEVEHAARGAVDLAKRAGHILPLILPTRGQ